MDLFFVIRWGLVVIWRDVREVCWADWMWITALGVQVTRMGLFGLGLPEVVVIAGVAALLFGEEYD